MGWIVVLYRLPSNNSRARLMTGSIVRVAGAVSAVRAKAAAVEPSLCISVERSSHALDPEDILRGILSEGADDRWITQAIAGRQGVFGKVFWRVVGRKGCVEPALGNSGVRSEWMDLGDQSY